MSHRCNRFYIFTMSITPLHTLTHISHTQSIFPSQNCMAIRLLSYEVADLCLGNPPLRSLSISATVADALFALKSSDDNHISVWSCNHSVTTPSDENCRCIGKLCMVDIICYLSKPENISAPSVALKSSVSVLLSNAPGLVRHVEPSASLLDAIEVLLQGAQNLIVPIKSRITSSNSKRKLLQQLSICPTAHNGREFCWLTTEDVIRFLLCSIGLFSPIPAYSIESLGLITHEILAIDYHSPAYAALGAISSSLSSQTSVAVIDDDGTLIGEISPFTLAHCDEMVAAAIATLSAGDLMAYIDCGGPPEDMIRVVEERLRETKLDGMLEEFSIYSSVVPSNNSSSSSSSSSSDEESMPSPTTPLRKLGRHNRSSSYSARMMKRAEAIVCHPRSSLVAVMIQAIAHRVNYVWVIEDDCSLVGIVTFPNILDVFRKNLQAMQ